jgi:hypothetical protein
MLSPVASQRPSERGGRPVGNGLCDDCAHQQLVPNTRGSVFSLCLRSREDPAYPRYPRVPVLSCPGHEPSSRQLAKGEQ